MKSASRKMLFVLSLAWIAFGIGCAGVEKKPTPPSLTKTDFEKLLDAGCRPVPDKPLWECDEEAYLKVGELGIRLQERVIGLEKDIKYYDDKLVLKEDFYKAKLGEWQRKWYITIPLGILAGGAISLTVYVAL